MTPLELWGGIECTVNRVGDAITISSSAPATPTGPTISTGSPRSGFGRLRYPVLWERVAPDGLERARLALDRRALGGSWSLGIAPIAGLVHHGSGPPSTDLLDRHFPSSSPPTPAPSPSAIRGSTPTRRSTSR